MTDIGERVRALRLGQTPPLTLAALAGEEVSIALLSKLERGHVNPSLATLRYLAQRLAVPLSTLLEDAPPGASHLARGALDAGRARLLLGDPAGAAAAALTAAGSLDPQSHSGLKARLLGLAADALCTVGQTAPAAQRLAEATALLTPERDISAAGCSRRLAQAELAWVLGAFERRRGSLDAAAGTWHGCLQALEEEPAGHPWWRYLRAATLGELGSLREARGDVELARNLIARAASLAAAVGDRLAVAQSLIANAPAASSSEAPSTDVDLAPASSAAAFALAVTVAADRLARRLFQDALRLEHPPATGLTTAAPSGVPQVPHSRHLQ